MLTSFLKNPEVKARFQQEFPKPSLKDKPVLLAPRLTENPWVLGTAFDYLLRFYVKYLNSQAQDKKWIPEKYLPIIEKSKYNYLYESSFLAVNKAKDNYTSFLETGEFTDNLLKSALALAKIETFIRSGKVFENLEEVKEEDIKDLKNLINIVNPNIFKTLETVILNPSWKEASLLVGGADGDLILDDLLVDIKTVTEFTIRREYFDQLMGYYVLSEIYRKKYPDYPEIKRLGIYFSRYAFLLVFKVEDIINFERFPNFLKWFISKASSQ